MKKIFVAVSLLLMSLGSTVTAQTIDDSNRLFKEVVQLVNTNGDKAQLYDVVYRCYTTTLAVLDNTPNGSNQNNQARNNMKDIMQVLANGAAYNNSIQHQADAVLFARAFVDVANRSDFLEFGYTSSQSYAQLSYFAAFNLYNARNYKEAIPYFKSYLRSGQSTYRQTVFGSMVKACNNTGNTTLALQTLDEAINETDNTPGKTQRFNYVSMAVNMCIGNKDNENLQRYVTQGLEMQPNNETLLNIQGKLYEDEREFEKALEVYKKLQVSHPKALDVIKHLAINNYNIGVLNFNKALSETDKKALKEYQKLYPEYFNNSIEFLRSVIISEPMSVKYTQALAVAYNCVGNEKELETVNNKLASLGVGKVSSDYIPSLIAYGQNGQNIGANVGGNANRNMAAAPVAQPQNNSSAATSGGDITIPSYSDFAVEFIKERVNKWLKKDPYETVTEYQTRVNEQNRDAKVKEYQRLAETEYIKRYQSLVNFYDLKLKPYDADHGVFLVTHETLGELIVPVPRENNEARVFESSWNGMEFKDPQFFINDNHLALAKLTMITPTGKAYTYDNAAALNYTETNVDVNFEDINAVLLANSGGKTKQTISKQNVKLGTSDVDNDIPEATVSNDNTYAVIISNENYQNVAGVPLALNDGSTFAEYCKKTLGIPKENVKYYPDATFGAIVRAIVQIKQVARAFNGDINILFYYAGHGIPNEATRDAFLLPVDGDGSQTETCYSLNRLYNELGSTNANSITVFLDACFSGSKREEGMLASARGVALKAKKEDPRGNMVVFSAASDDETAYPYKTKGHGLFTYFLLKKLQESKGHATLGEISDYVKTNVAQQSIRINQKSQTATTTPSETMTETWRDMHLMPDAPEPEPTDDVQN